MRKLLSIIIALTLVFSMAVVLTACNNKTDEPTSDVSDEDTIATEITEETDTETEASEEDTEDANLPNAGDTVKIGTTSVTIPEGWTVEEYTEGEEIELQPADAFLESVTVSLNKVYGDDHAKEWADNINGNYGGDKEIDTVEIGGKSFYRVKAEDEQNICFADIDDSNYIKVSVMFMPWEESEPVLSTITFE